MATFAMRAPLFRTVSQHRLAWLLWLALLLPIAQAAATWHALSHMALEESGAADGKQAPHTTHCDLCLTAAALSGGALTDGPPSLPHPLARHQAPQTASASVWLELLTRAYHSRAPPLASH